MKKSFYQAKTPEEALKLYFQGDSELYGQIKNRILRAVIDRLYRKKQWKGTSVLEIGAAGGVWTDYFVRKDCKVTCVDISKQILKGNERLHPQARFVLADATHVKFNEKFDLVFAKDVIEHIQDDSMFLKNMNNHLNDNGLIILNTQNSFCLNYLIQGGYHLLRGNKKWCGWDPTHLRFYNFWSLKKKLAASGFKPIKWFGSYYFPYRILDDRCGKWSNLKIFHIVELLGLYDMFPFNLIGWNIGVIAKKVQSQ